LLESPQLRVRRAETAAPPLLVGQFPETQIFEDEVGKELTFAAVSRGTPPATALREAEAALGQLGLSGRITPGRHTWELSTGERRLVLLIAALVAPASLLALDEPTAGLDPLRKEALGRLIVHRSDSCLVLIASQDAAWVASLPSVRASLPPPEIPSSPSEKTD
jgi:energy-coupling factor transporter ATP-binding protein EcfA2